MPAYWTAKARSAPPARGRAVRAADQVYVSAVTGWEVAIKTSLGRLRPRRTVAQAVAEGLTLVTRDPVFRAYRVKLVRA